MDIQLPDSDGFALLDLQEAERVRALGWRGPILLLEGVFEARDLELCSRLDLWHVVHCDAQVDWLASHKTHKPHRVFLKLNSGMNRLGFAPKAFRDALDRIRKSGAARSITLMTHFGTADGPDGIGEALRRFESCQTAAVHTAVDWLCDWHARAAERARIDWTVTPRTLRHSYATHLMDAGVDLAVISSLMGHRSPSETGVYLHVLKDKPRQAVKRLPMEGGRP